MSYSGRIYDSHALKTSYQTDKLSKEILLNQNESAKL